MCNRAAIGFTVAFLLLFATVGLLVYQQQQLRDERDQRVRKDNQAFLTNCLQREKEIGDLRRHLGLPPTGYDCLSLPVLER